MRNGKPLLQCALLLVAVTVMVLGASGSLWAAGEAAKPGIARADLIKINAIAKYQKLEMGKPIFAHDQHTEALAAMGKDCSACHLSAKDGKMSLKFMRLEDKSAKELQSLYHEKCMGCHTAIKKSGTKSGPQDGECKSCHDLAGKYVSTFVRQGYGAASHAAHVASKLVPPPAGEARNCATCHHNVKTPGKEDSCRVCHLEAHGVKPDYPTVGHTFCVDCHNKVVKQAPKAPVNCAGCHSAEAVAKQQSTKDVPRLMRGQPDQTVMFPVTAIGDGKAAMAPVVFDHKVHEGKVAGCRTCHHLRIGTCGSCHTAEGSAAGGYVSLEASMHKEDSARSCVGCHQKQLQKAECAGCHGFVKPERNAAYCAVCHVPGLKPTDDQTKAGVADKLPLAEKVQLAGSVKAERKPAGLPDYDKVPDVVIIGSLKDKYEANEFNHRAHIENYIGSSVDSDKLGQAFHTDKATLCQGCHHMSPPSMTPPKCSSCHGKEQSANAAGRPALKAAYHMQCMGCHDRMKVEPVAKTDCAGCHSERKK